MITTKSPLDDPKVKEATLRAVKNQYGMDKAGELLKNNNPDTEERLDEDIVDYKAELSFDWYIKNLLDTTHLKDFDKFDKYLGLDGDTYIPFKKCLWYQAHSLKQPPKGYKINYKTHIDNRPHILAIAPPASGKSTSKIKMRNLIPQKDSIETSGLCHPQQLIGKTIPATTKKPKRDIPGFLSYDLLIHDEVQDFLNEKNDLYAQSQKLKRQAMDSFGINQIDKKLVTNEPGEETICYSPSRFLDFAHPKKLESPFFDTGSFRRYFIFNLQSSENLDLDSLTEFKLDKKTNYQNYALSLNEESKGKKWDTHFNQQTLDIISNCHATILRFLLNSKNENAFRYGMMMRFDFRSKLSKMVYILALANGERIPSVDTTVMACRDTILFILESIKAINELADIGTTSDVWKGLDEENAMAMNWLLKKKSFSYETSNVTINKFWTILSHVHGVRLTQARSHYYKLKKDGFIDSRKGKNDSRIWLKFIPKEFQLIDSGTNNIESFGKLIKTVGPKTPILTVLKELYIDDKEFEKAQSDGSAGVTGYIIYNAYKLRDILYIKYIYNKDPPTLAEPTVLIGSTLVIEDKEYNQDYQKPQNEPTVLEQVDEENEEKSTRDTQYFEAKECELIKPVERDKVLTYIQENPNYTLSKLLELFGPSVISLKKEGLIK